MASVLDSGNNTMPNAAIKIQQKYFKEQEKAKRIEKDLRNKLQSMGLLMNTTSSIAPLSGGTNSNNEFGTSSGPGDGLNSGVPDFMSLIDCLDDVIATESVHSNALVMLKQGLTAAYENKVSEMKH